MTPTFLVTGRDGQLGFELRRTLAPLGRVVAIDVDNLDLCDIEAVRKFVRELRPEVIVNAAAYTAVDRAETERELSNTINGVIPGVLAEEIKKLGGKGIVHYSTDYVFAGDGNRPYKEEVATSPVNAYGASKLAGEQTVQGSGAPHVILRTEWLYATRGANFLLTILRLARQGKPLRIIADQTGSPTWARMLAETSAAIAARMLTGRDLGDISGVYHATASGQTSWHGFAEAILQESLERLKKLGRESDWCERALGTLTPILTSEYPTPAKRPAYSVLSGDKLERVFGIRMPEWREQLRYALEDYLFPSD
jgi:dTDP-4-dehydrorhamnose reductase